MLQYLHRKQMKIDRPPGGHKVLEQAFFAWFMFKNIMCGCDV